MLIPFELLCQVRLRLTTAHPAEPFTSCDTWLSDVCVCNAVTESSPVDVTLRYVRLMMQRGTIKSGHFVHVHALNDLLCNI